MLNSYLVQKPGAENIKLNLRFNLFHQILIRNRILATKRNAVIPIRTLLKEFNFLNAEWVSDNIEYVKSELYLSVVRLEWIKFLQKNRTDLNDVKKIHTCKTL